jgi:GNAT superfamily N-acetyltransferase
MGRQSKLDAALKRQRASKRPLREQLLERIRLIGGEIDLASDGNRKAFAEVWDGLSIPRIDLAPVQGECWASLEEGGTIVVKALIYFEGEPIGMIQRRLAFGRRLAVHELLFLGPSVRGRGLSVALLLASFDLYDRLEFREVQLEAAMETGRWFWARVGFEFIRDEDARLVREWAIAVIKATEVRGLRVDCYTAAGQFARMGGRRKLSLGRIAEAMPLKAAEIEQIAAANGLRLTQRIELGRAVMITGPAWFGRLDLKGPERAAFNAYAAAKITRIQDQED